MKISAILAVGKDNVVGLNGGLPWKSKADLQYFKTLTEKHHILMGYNTYKSIGRPLPNRVNIVITSRSTSNNSRSTNNNSKSMQIHGVEMFSSVEDGIEFAKRSGEEELFIIGGASIYKYCDEHKLLDRIYVNNMIC